MKNLLFTLLLFSCLATQSFGQYETPSFNTHHKNIYLELLGSHILLGVNYDMRLKKGRMDGIGFRVGVGGFSAESSDVNLGLVSFPIEFNHLLGKRNAFVAGMGLLPIYATFSANTNLKDYEYIEAEGFGLAGGFLNLGYRLQPKNNGLMLQVNWNPLILRGSGFNAGWIGIGIGIGFK